MEWVKKGLIYRYSATTPNPILLNKNTIRVYVGRRDRRGVGRIGYVDLGAENPKKILRVSTKPVLDIGKPGAFDDNGVILGDVIKRNGAYLMYYVGFQLAQKVKFMAFSGLAESRDNGETFVRVRNTPIFDRTPEELHIRTIHTIIPGTHHWDVWYAAGNSWEMIGGMPHPRYAIYYTTSKDGKTFTDFRIPCIRNTKKEYRIGRPKVYKDSSGYHMFYTIGTRSKTYLPGYAQSRDGIHWRRKDDQIGISPSASGWDSQMLCYPALLTYKKTTYMFYNGNGMGESGFGYAILSRT